MLAACLAQQRAVTAAHQRITTLHQANGPIPELVGLPGPFGDTADPKESLGNCSITVALDSRIERAQGQRQPLSTLWGQVRKCGAGREIVERPPEPAGGVGANLEIIVEQQLGGIRQAGNQRLSQPEPMFDAANAQNGVPTVCGLTKFNSRQIGQSNGVCVGGSGDADNRDDGGKNLRRPVDRLILRGECGISRKRIGPMSFGRL